MVQGVIPLLFDGGPGIAGGKPDLKRLEAFLPPGFLSKRSRARTLLEQRPLPDVVKRSPTDSTMRPSDLLRGTGHVSSSSFPVSL